MDGASYREIEMEKAKKVIILKNRGIKESIIYLVI